jgi:hypothetical protein
MARVEANVSLCLNHFATATLRQKYSQKLNRSFVPHSFRIASVAPGIPSVFLFHQDYGQRNEDRNRFSSWLRLLSNSLSSNQGHLFFQTQKEDDQFANYVQIREHKSSRISNVSATSFELFSGRFHDGTGVCWVGFYSTTRIVTTSRINFGRQFGFRLPSKFSKINNTTNHCIFSIQSLEYKSLVGK